MDRVIGLGHVGIYVRDLDRMVHLYRDVLGMTVTKRNEEAGLVFLSSDPLLSDHEIVLLKGRDDENGGRLIQQISLRVESLEALRRFRQRILDEGLKVEVIASHVSAIGVYFLDSEDNRTEVFWLTGRPCWVPTASPIDIDRPDADVLDDIDTEWARLRDVRIGGELPADVSADLRIPE
jgi:catechol 2,3-dioxygenase-like lactoylglutathione lyase family enzyme